MATSVQRSPPDVVVVDDHADTVEMIAEMLTFRGFTVRAFTDPARALEDIRAHPPDLALIDLRMPRIGGRDVARALREDARLRAVVLVGVSGALEPKTQPDLFDAWLAKPLDLVTLPDLLRSLADARATT